jgi:hypothetical protein
MPTKALTTEQVAHLTQFVQPYWHDETKCAAEVAMGVIEDQKLEIQRLQKTVAEQANEISLLHNTVSKAIAALSQVKYVLSDQPTPEKILDTSRLARDYGRLRGYLDAALADVEDQAEASMRPRS